MSESNKKFVTKIIMTRTPTEKDGAQWFFYLGARSQYIDQHPEEYEGKLGRVIPTFEEELAGRTILAEGCAHSQNQGKEPPSLYLSELLRVHQAGYLREYTWWLCNRPQWPIEKRPERLVAFMAWMAKHLASHQVETYGWIEIEQKTEEAGKTDSGQESVSLHPPGHGLDIKHAGGEELQPQLHAAHAMLKTGRIPEALELMRRFASACEGLRKEKDSVYVCVRTQRELDFFLASRPDLRSIRVLHWCVAEGLYFRCYLLSHLQRAEEALDAMQELLEVAPFSAQGHAERGFIANKRHRSEEALQAYSTAWDLASRLPENCAAAAPALRGMGVSLAGLQRCDEAEARLRDSLILDPGNKVALDELGYVQHLRMGGQPGFFQ